MLANKFLRTTALVVVVIAASVALSLVLLGSRPAVVSAQNATPKNLQELFTYFQKKQQTDKEFMITVHVNEAVTASHFDNLAVFSVGDDHVCFNGGTTTCIAFNAITYVGTNKPAF